MPKKTVADVDVKGKRVLMRVDFNVPIEDGQVGDDRRIVQAIPTITNVTDRGGRVVLMSHLGRPKEGPDPRFSLRPVAEHLENLLGKPVRFVPNCIGLEVEQAVQSMNDGDVVLLENLRFLKGEEKNDPNFAAQLAKLGEVYVNDAFGTAHREHASTFGVPQLMQGKPRVIGFLIQKELRFLGEAITEPQRPFVAILGDAKVSDKIKVIEKLLEKADTLLIGGAMANTFLLASGREMGNSMVEPDLLGLARELIGKARFKLKLPIDSVVSEQVSDEADTQVASGDVPAGMMALDIGPETARLYRDDVMKAKTVVWNGPMGVFEKEPFADGTQEIAEACAEATQKHEATTIIGGGDSAAAVEQFGLAGQVTHVSTGGGA